MIAAYTCNPYDITAKAILGVVEVEDKGTLSGTCEAAANLIVADIEKAEPFRVCFDSLFVSVLNEDEEGENKFNQSNLIESFLRRIAFEKGFITE